MYVNQCPLYFCFLTAIFNLKAGVVTGMIQFEHSPNKCENRESAALDYEESFYRVLEGISSYIMKLQNPLKSDLV
jgi:hypothetical protein